MSRSTQTLLLTMLLAATPLAIFAQDATPPAQSSADAQHLHAIPGVETGTYTPSQAEMRALPKPGDRACLQDTGSLIPPKKGTCLAVHGNSYTADDIKRTGEPDTARALQMLDPSVTVRGH